EENVSYGRTSARHRNAVSAMERGGEAVQQLSDAANKVLRYPTVRVRPHREGGDGLVELEVSCSCGMTDLRRAVERLAAHQGTMGPGRRSFQTERAAGGGDYLTSLSSM